MESPIAQPGILCRACRYHPLSSRVTEQLVLPNSGSSAAYSEALVPCLQTILVTAVGWNRPWAWVYISPCLFLQWRYGVEQQSAIAPAPSAAPLPTMFAARWFVARTNFCWGCKLRLASWRVSEERVPEQVMYGGGGGVTRLKETCSRWQVHECTRCLGWVC